MAESAGGGEGWGPGRGEVLERDRRIVQYILQLTRGQIRMVAAVQ